MKASPFTKKYSVQFFTSDGRSSSPFYFGETEVEGHAQTWQVLRSEFDILLIDNAAKKGAEVHQGVVVKEVLLRRRPRPRGGDPDAGRRQPRRSPPGW